MIVTRLRFISFLLKCPSSYKNSKKLVMEIFHFTFKEIKPLSNFYITNYQLFNIYIFSRKYKIIMEAKKCNTLLCIVSITSLTTVYFLGKQHQHLLRACQKSDSYVLSQPASLQTLKRAQPSVFQVCLVKLESHTLWNMKIGNCTIS